MSKVIKHAVIYTGSEKIEDGYIRFDKQIEAVGRMSEYVAKLLMMKLLTCSARRSCLVLLTFISMAATVLTRWMAMPMKLTKW